MSAIVMDMEAVLDKDLVLRSEGCSVEAYMEALREKTGKADPFPPYAYHRPVCLAAFVLDGDKTKAVAYRDSDEESIASRWWAGYTELVPVVVTWGGRNYDLPLLEVLAMREGIACPEWFHAPPAKAWEDPRHRLSGAHVDLCDWLCNGGGTSRLSMSVAAEAIGLPGKLGTSGGDVAELYAAGKTEESAAYCATDVLTTLAIFLRMRQATGERWSQDPAVVEATLNDAAGQFHAMGAEFEAACDLWWTAYEERKVPR